MWVDFLPPAATQQFVVKLKLAAAKLDVEESSKNTFWHLNINC